MTAEELQKKPAVRPFWKDAINPKAVHPDHRFMVVNMATLTAVESCWGPESAARVANTLNDHAKACAEAGQPLVEYDAFAIER